MLGRAWRDDMTRAPGAPFLVAWVIALIALKLTVANLLRSQNAAGWVAAIRDRVDFEPREILFVEDQPRYALHLNARAEIEEIALDPTTTNRFNPDYDEPLAEDIADEDGHALFITTTAKWPTVCARRASRLRHHHARRAISGSVDVHDQAQGCCSGGAARNELSDHRAPRTGGGAGRVFA